MPDSYKPVTIQTILFDLDGTLADTAPDPADALNQVLVDHGKQALAFEDIRPAASHGSPALIKLGFNLLPDDSGYNAIRDQLLSIYAHNIAVKTRLFPGMSELLSTITQRRMKWGVVTNKPAFLTEPLLEALAIAKHAACIVSGDTLPQRKPDPAPLIHACQLSASKVAQCIYVGDAERDIQAGRRAGMKTLVALFGYLAPHDQPETWQADGMIESPAQIMDWLEQQNLV